LSITDSAVVRAILPDLGFLETLFEAMEWAESEIEKAMARNGEPKPPEGTRGPGRSGTASACSRRPTTRSCSARWSTGRTATRSWSA